MGSRSIGPVAIGLVILGLALSALASAAGASALDVVTAAPAFQATPPAPTLAPAKLTVTVDSTTASSVSSTTGSISACAFTAGACQAVFAHDTEVTLTSTADGEPDPIWTGCDASTATTCTVTMSQPRSVTADFTP